MYSCPEANYGVNEDREHVCFIYQCISALCIALPHTQFLINMDEDRCIFTDALTFLGFPECREQLNELLQFLKNDILSFTFNSR